MGQARHFSGEVQLIGLIFETADPHHLTKHTQVFVAIILRISWAHSLVLIKMAWTSTLVQAVGEFSTDWQLEVLLRGID